MVVPPGGERAATALGLYEAEGERVSLLLVVVGPRTRELAALPVGAPLDLLGPLGNGFDLDALGDDVALVAGGVGLASLLLPAQRCAPRGARTTLYYGARTAAALVDRELFAAPERNWCSRPTTARSVMPDMSARRCAPRLALTPHCRLRTIADVARGRASRARRGHSRATLARRNFCLRRRRVLGLRGSARAGKRAGAGLSAAPAGEKRDYVHARICKEGPVFWAHELRW
jgi:NAD(P)H-flavin reductase